VNNEVIISGCQNQMSVSGQGNVSGGIGGVQLALTATPPGGDVVLLNEFTIPRRLPTVLEPNPPKVVVEKKNNAKTAAGCVGGSDGGVPVKVWGAVAQVMVQEPAPNPLDPPVACDLTAGTCDGIIPTVV